MGEGCRWQPCIANAHILAIGGGTHKFECIEKTYARTGRSLTVFRMNNFGPSGQPKAFMH